MSYPITAFQKDQGKQISGSQKDTVLALRNPTITPDISFADRYYSMSSLVSYMTLQSRYIIPPDVSMEVKQQQLIDDTMDAYYIAPVLAKGQGVYEFPANESFSKAAKQGTSSPSTILISWLNQDTEEPEKLIDGAINWGQSLSGTPYDGPGFELSGQILLPKVVKSQFIQLADTPEIATNTRDINANKKSIAALEDRITTLETFLSNFLTTSVNTDTQSNYYFGLQNMPSDTYPSWNDISSSGVWRQLV